VDRPWNRKFLGFTVSRNGMKLKVADKAIDKLKDRVRELTRRTRGHRLRDVVAELRDALLGWKAYFGIAEVLSPLRDIDKWIRRKLRCYHWKQWGRAGYRELRRRGVSVREALEHQQVGARALAAVKDPRARTRTTGTLLQQSGVAKPRTAGRN